MLLGRMQARLDPRCTEFYCSKTHPRRWSSYYTTHVCFIKKYTRILVHRIVASVYLCRQICEQTQRKKNTWRSSTRDATQQCTSTRSDAPARDAAAHDAAVHQHTTWGTDSPKNAWHDAWRSSAPLCILSFHRKKLFSVICDLWYVDLWSCDCLKVQEG